MAKGLHNFVLYRVMDREIHFFGSRYLKGRLVDIGCGTKPYEEMLAPYVSAHVGVDREDPFNQEARVDLVGTAYDIPAEDSSFDCAISTATLEHLAEPEQALRETNRVLRPGGIALYTVPLIWHIHSPPWDYYRFTNFGLQHLFEKTGFDVIEIKALSGFWLTFGQLFVYYMYRFNRGPLRLIPVIPLGGVIVQIVSYALDRLDKASDWTWMYLVVARKRSEDVSPESAAG